MVCPPHESKLPNVPSEKNLFIIFGGQPVTPDWDLEESDVLGVCGK